MDRLIRALLRYRNVVLIVFLATLAVGSYAFFQLDIEAYPDPSPPMVEFITQNPSWSAEEMEQQVTIPLETGLNGTPQAGTDPLNQHLRAQRREDVLHLRQRLLHRSPGSAESPPGNQSSQQPAGAAVARVSSRRDLPLQLTGPGYSLNELKATQDWLLVREIKQVPGIIDVAIFGGTTRQYQAEVDPNKLLRLRRHHDPGRQRGSEQQRQRGWQLSHARRPERQRPRHRPAALARRHEQHSRRRAQWRPVLLARCSHVKEGHQPRLGNVGARSTTTSRHRRRHRAAAEGSETLCPRWPRCARKYTI